jgi:hypothetical protein
MSPYLPLTIPRLAFVCRGAFLSNLRGAVALEAMAIGAQDNHVRKLVLFDSGPILYMFNRKRRDCTAGRDSATITSFYKRARSSSAGIDGLPWDMGESLVLPDDPLGRESLIRL